MATKKKAKKSTRRRARIEYRKRSGYHVKGDIQKIGQFIDKLANKKKYTVRDVVELAKDPKCPLHAEFTWNIHQAAQTCWESQAKYIMAAVTKVVIRANGEEEERSWRVTAMIHTGLVGGSGRPVRVYASESQSLSDPIERYNVLDEALLELRAFINKYRTLSELAGVRAEANKLFRRLVRKAAK